jgi:tripartite ATP-independent transporter DctM subunit
MSITIAISIAILLLLLMLGISVPASFFGTTLFLIVACGYTPSFLVPYAYSKVSNYVLLAIPLFIIAGGIIERSDLGAHLVNFVYMLVGRVKGSLGMVAVIACAMFGSVTGSACATMSVIGSIMWPRMEAAGYSKGKSAALISSSCLLGGLIPPSSLMIMYAWIAQQSVLKCFLAILGPGLMMTVMFCIAYWFQVRHDEGMETMPKMTKVEYRKELEIRFVKFIPAVIFPIIILGGIYSGIMTPTESASVSLIYALIAGFFIYRTLTFKKVKDVLVSSSNTIGVIMVMLFMVMMLSRIFITEDVPTMILSALSSISDNKYVILAIVNIFMIIIGMLMDDASATLLSVPILLPVVQAVGVDPIHFAAIVAVNISLGCITPPCAPLMYLGARLSNTDVAEVLKPTFQLIFAVWLPALILVTYIPAISMFFPSLLSK